VGFKTNKQKNLYWLFQAQEQVSLGRSTGCSAVQREPVLQSICISGLISCLDKLLSENHKLRGFSNRRSQWLPTHLYFFSWGGRDVPIEVQINARSRLLL